MIDLLRQKELHDQFRIRVLVAFSLVILGFLVLLLHFYDLQVVRYEFYHARAEGNRISLLPIIPQRGEIFDRYGQPLAKNYVIYNAVIDPTIKGDVNQTIETLASLIPVTENDRTNFAKQMKEMRYFNAVTIRSNLTEQEVAIIAANHYRLSGVDIQIYQKRAYPQGEVMGHVLGYIGRINEKDQEHIEQEEQEANYRGSNYIGKSGLELSYERQLHGMTGIEKVEINAHGRAVKLLDKQAPIAGKDLYLSIDVELQRLIEQELAGRNGAVVAIDPRNGEVLALVSSPMYDPNLFIDGISYHDWQVLNDSPDRPMLNRAIYSAFPPGSIFKPFMAILGLEGGYRRPNQYFNHQGVFVLGNQKHYDKKSHCQNGVNLHRALTFSCNVYFYTLAQDIGINKMSNFFHKFGFGQRTGIDIPGESSGILPSPEWKKQRFAHNKKQYQTWYKGDTVMIGIGQGYSAYTPIQMANALATLINGGKRFAPHVVTQIKNPVTGKFSKMPSKVLSQLHLKPENVAEIRSAMHDVTRIGTAARSFIGANYQAGGKTGTAQVFSLAGRRYDAKRLQKKLLDHGWFMGFAPLDNPTIAIAVFVENGGGGGVVAAPIARKVFDFYLNKQNRLAIEQQNKQGMDNVEQKAP